VNLALFDFDGTITTREMLPDFFRLAIPRRRLLAGQVLLAPLIVGYRLGWVPGTVVRAAIVRFGFTGLPVGDYGAFAAAFATQVLPGVLRPEVMQRIAWHRAQGDQVVVVSGGLDVYLAHWCREHGLDLVCSVLEQRDGRLTGRYQGAQCVRAEKARRVERHYPRANYDEVYAYGDTVEDRELLALATRKFYRGVEVTHCWPELIPSP
jgi:HAD superfamily hydrolase (TIGR01490 family)